MKDKKTAKAIKAAAVAKDAAIVSIQKTARSKKEARRLEKERVSQLERDGLTRRQAKEVVHAETTGNTGLQVGMLTQYFDHGLRAGFIADVPEHGQVKIQPIGPKGAEEPSCKFVKLINLVPITQPTKENDMTAIAKKAAELKTKVAAQKSEKAAKLADNLKKVKGQDVAVVAEKGAKTALKNPTVLKAAKAAKESTDKVVKPAPAKKAAKAAKKSSEPKTEQTWTFVKNGPASGQRLVILETLKGKLGGKATRTKLAEALSKVVESSQDANTILRLKKKFLVDNGCIKIS